MKPRLPGGHDPARKRQREELAAEPGDHRGYCRPPKQTRFKPGQSGNLEGRPKRSRNRKTMVDDALFEEVPVLVDGKEQRLSKLEIGVRKLANKFAAGDPKAGMQLLALRTALRQIADPGEARTRIRVTLVKGDAVDGPEDEVVRVCDVRSDTEEA